MRKIVTLFAAALLIFAAPAIAQKTDKLGNNLFGEWNDSVKSNTTKVQKIKVASPGGITIQAQGTHVADTITGYVSVWCSLDDSLYVPFPGADSVAISATADVGKMWFLNNKEEGNKVQWIELRWRCPSNTTNSTSKMRLRSKLFRY